MTRKLLLFFAALLLSVTGINAQDFTSGYLKYTVTNPAQKLVTVTSHTDELPIEAEIPATVSYKGANYTVTAIGKSAFNFCLHLEQITIPNTVITIGDYAFSKCSSLKQITIPESVTTIGDSAFEACSTLGQITIPNSVTTLGDYAFRDCDSLMQIAIPDNVTSIGEGAFITCVSLAQITLGNNVTTIRDEAFYRCAFKQITLGNSITTIGAGAFKDCKQLEQITALSLTPPTLKDDGYFPFEGVDNTIPVFVPEDSFDAYKASDWNYFTNLQEGPNGNVQQPTLVEGVRYADEQLLNPQQLLVSVYDLTGRLVYRGNDSTRAFPSGVYIVSYGRTTEKMVF